MRVIGSVRVLVVRLEQPENSVMLVFSPKDSPTNPVTSQSPAVSEIDVTFFAVVEVSDTADPANTADETYSPTLPALASLLVVVPFIPVSCPGVSSPVTPKVPDAVKFFAAKSWVDNPASAAAPSVDRATAAVVSSRRVRMKADAVSGVATRKDSNTMAEVPITGSVVVS